MLFQEQSSGLAGGGGRWASRSPRGSEVSFKCPERVQKEGLRFSSGIAQQSVVSSVLTMTLRG